MGRHVSIGAFVAPGSFGHCGSCMAFIGAGIGALNFPENLKDLEPQTQ
jgi:hypothetical protein